MSSLFLQGGDEYRQGLRDEPMSAAVPEATDHTALHMSSMDEPSGEQFQHYHHVEDISDQSSHPPWSTGVSARPSRMHSPRPLISVSESEFLAYVDDNQSRPQETDFNPAQIPYNLMSLEVHGQDNRQISIADVVEHIETSKPSVDDMFESSQHEDYEHQNMMEAMADEGQQVEPMLEIPAVSDAEEAKLDENLIIHQPIERDAKDASLSEYFGNPVETDFVEFLKSHEQSEFDDILESTTEETPRASQIEFGAHNTVMHNTEKSTNGNYQDHDRMTSISTIPITDQVRVNQARDTSIVQDTNATTVNIPDDLDETEFDIETELDAEFAAMEASFTQNLTLGTQDPQPTVIPPSVNPYLPSGTNVGTSAPINRYIPAPPILESAAQQDSQATLFTPAHISQKSIEKANVYGASKTNALPFGAPAGPITKPAEQFKKSSASSFVSGKAAYADPYALPELLVAKKRVRPQAQTLRAATSVPNLKAPGQMRPPIGQRHVSSVNPGQPVPQHQPSPFARPPFNHNTAQSPYALPARMVPPKSNGAVPSTFYSPAPGNDSRNVQPAHAPPQNYYAPPSQDQYTPRNLSYSVPDRAEPVSISEGSPFLPRPESYAGNQVGQGNHMTTNMAEVAPSTHQPYALHADTRESGQAAVLMAPPDQGQSSHLNAVEQQRQAATMNPRQFQAPPPLQRGPSPLRENMATSINAVMNGRPSPLQNEFMIQHNSSPHQRHQSSASTVSQESDHRQEAVYREYLDQQRNAENRMFGDSFAVAEDDIHEAQELQRRDAYSPSLTRPASALQRPQTQPFSASVSQSSAQPISYAPRRSLDEKTVKGALEMSRPSSRGSDNRYAHTEPSHSPRQANAMLPTQTGNAKLNALTGRRPQQLTRATSSNHAYQSFPRSASPIPMMQGLGNRASESGGFDRCAGHPIASFGFGGKLLTTIPKTIPKFSVDGTMTHRIAGPGPVMIRSIKDLNTGDVFGDFPGPLLHTKTAAKQRKADLQLWLAKRIPPANAETQNDKTVLYRLLMLLLEFDGALATPVAKDKLIALLQPGLTEDTHNNGLSNFKVASSISAPEEHDQGTILATTTLTDTTVSKLSALLLRGDRESALRLASERKLWAHALIIASRISPQSWTTVVNEFALTELHVQSEASESLKFAYQSFVGGAPQSTATPIIRKHANTSLVIGESSDYPLRNWRKSLAGILNNRGVSDDLAIASLGKALSARGDVYAAHFCYLMCSQPSLGPVDDPRAVYSLIGLRDIAGPWTSDRNEAVVLSEIYEFSASLAQPKSLGLPHLLAFKLQRALLLTEAGFAPAAKRYCDGITGALKILPKNSTHLHHVLVEQLRDLSHRLDQSVGEGNSSWIGSKLAKPKMDNIWGSLEGKFSKFVAGDSVEEPIGEDGSLRGPFAKLAQTPALSRVQSVADLRNRQPSQTQQFHHGGYEQEPAQPAYTAALTEHSAYPYPASETQTLQQVLPSGQPAHAYLNSVQTPVATSRYSPVVGRQPSYFSSQTLENQGGESEHLYLPIPQSLEQPRQRPDMSVNSSQVSYTQQASFNSHDIDSRAGFVQTPNLVAAASPFGSQQQYQANAQAPAPPPPSSYSPYTPEVIKSAPDTQSHAAQEFAVESRSNPPVVSPKMVAPAVIGKEETEELAAKTDGGEEKKSGWLGGWFGGKKKEAPAPKEGDAKVHKAKLGEGMSLVYDPVTKKWTNPKGNMPEESKSGAPPPPMSRKMPAANGPSPRPLQSQRTPTGIAGPETHQTSADQGPITRPSPGSTAPSGTLPRKVQSAEDDLAAMLGSGPAPRRAASAAGGPPGPGANSTRAKKSKPAKRYVDVFQDGA